MTTRSDTVPAAQARSGGTARPVGDRRLRTAAGLGALGGTMFFLDLSLQAFGALGRSYFAVATVVGLCLLGVPAAYWLRGATGAGWARAVAAAGTVLVACGVGAWTTAFALLARDPGLAFTQKLTPLGSVLMAAGMLLLGVGVLASRRMSGPARWAPLLVGLYFPAQVAVQLTLFLGGRDEQQGPDGTLLGTWGLLWAWAASSAWAARGDVPQRGGVP